MIKYFYKFNLCIIFVLFITIISIYIKYHFHIKKNVILIGNGSKLLDFNYGEVIDNFDEIVRFNGYQINTFEKHLGSKTHTYFCTDEWQHEINNNITKKIYLFNPVKPVNIIKKENMKFLIDNKLHISFKKLTKYPIKQHLSTGFFAILYYLYHLKHPFITIANFDFNLDKSRPIEYFNKNTKRSPWHAFELEKQFVIHLIKEGRVKLLHPF